MTQKNQPNRINSVDWNDITNFRTPKISTNQAVLVALIGLVSAIAVAMIANVDKIGKSKDVSRDEIGYYEARADNVESAFKEVENELKSQIELARERGKPETITGLRDLADEVTKTHAQFQALHKEHLAAIQNGQRLSASKLKTEANESISDLNYKLLDGSRGRRVDIWNPNPREASRFGKRTIRLTVLELGGRRRIPLYGKNDLNNQSMAAE